MDDELASTDRLKMEIESASFPCLSLRCVVHGSPDSAYAEASELIVILEWKNVFQLSIGMFIFLPNLHARIETQFNGAKK